LRTELEFDIAAMTHACLQAERARGLGQASLKELKRYLGEFDIYCEDLGIDSVEALRAGLSEDYVEGCWERGGPPLVKVSVWSWEKFGECAWGQVCP
jgi:hypothetical protein